MPYEVQQNTITHGWCNNWYVKGADGVTRLRTFATAEEAEAVLDDYLCYLDDEFPDPDLNRYLRDSFRVRCVSDTPAGD